MKKYSISFPAASSSVKFFLSFSCLRDEHCLAEPEFCISFVKELGVTNLVLLCKVSEKMNDGNTVYLLGHNGSG